jgi:hypothetical protein
MTSRPLPLSQYATLPDSLTIGIKTSGQALSSKRGRSSSGKIEYSDPFRSAQVMSRCIWQKPEIKKARNAGIIWLVKDWQLAGSELVSQEREKSGTKKYPVLGIFQITSPLSRYSGQALSLRRGRSSRGQIEHWGPVERSLHSA